MFVSINVRSRPFKQSKGQLSELRHTGWIPAVIYGGNKQNVGVSICAKAFLKEMETPGIKTRVFQITLEDSKEPENVLVKEMAFSATKDTPLHIDFLRLGERVTLSVPLRFIHEELSPGIKRGGVMNIIHHSVDVSVSASNIPHEILVDLKGVDIGYSVHLSDLDLPEGVQILRLSKEESIVSIVVPSGLDLSAEKSEEA